MAEARVLCMTPVSPNRQRKKGRKSIYRAQIYIATGSLASLEPEPTENGDIVLPDAAVRRVPEYFAGLSIAGDERVFAECAMLEWPHQLKDAVFRLFLHDSGRQMNIGIAQPHFRTKN